jgi:hypothetical protein
MNRRAAWLIYYLGDWRCVKARVPFLPLSAVFGIAVHLTQRSIICWLVGHPPSMADQVGVESPDLKRQTAMTPAKRAHLGQAATSQELTGQRNLFGPCAVQGFLQLVGRETSGKIVER